MVFVECVLCVLWYMAHDHESNANQSTIITYIIAVSCIPVFCAVFEEVSWGLHDECTVNGYHISKSVVCAGCVMTAHMTRCVFVDSIDIYWYIC